MIVVRRIWQCHHVRKAKPYALHSVKSCWVALLMPVFEVCNIRHRLTCEGKNWAVGSASGQEVGHVASSGVHKDGRGPQVVGHCCSAGTQFLADLAVRDAGQLRQHNLAILLLPTSSRNLMIIVLLCLY